jgi:rSAM/selenodomain-associated transferase 2
MAGPRARVSIVIPALDEERAIGAVLSAALAQADDVVVSDGGSRDRTVEIAREMGARVVAGPRGRGLQLNRGAAAASEAGREPEDILLFLHADTALPEGGVELVRQAIAAGAVGGAFEIRFDGRGWVYRLGERIASLRSRWSRLALGDQAQFVRRERFEDLGGFRDWPLLEDLDFMLRLRETGRIAILRRPVVTSARRFAARGPLRTVLGNWWIWTQFVRGVPPRELAARYLDVR